MLVPFKYESLPLGSIKASGWLQDQLALSADGLGGYLFDFYRYVKRSTWLGGDTEYSELHESAPYWFNYIVPLAWTLDDDRLKQQAREFLDYVLRAPGVGWLAWPGNDTADSRHLGAEPSLLRTHPVRRGRSDAGGPYCYRNA